jgi:ribosomal protein S18 acetylase RimI-like enzyme
MTDSLRLRKHLLGDLAQPVWPAGTRLAALSAVDPPALHLILAAAYANGFGSVPPFEAWWSGLTADSEYDPALVFIAADKTDQPIGIAQCWTSGFVKDVAVMPAWRNRGIGEALLREAFHAFHRRGLAHVDLKVVTGNAPAIALYRRIGMVEVPL